MANLFQALLDLIQGVIQLDPVIQTLLGAGAAIVAGVIYLVYFR